MIFSTRSWMSLTFSDTTWPAADTPWKQTPHSAQSGRTWLTDSSKKRHSSPRQRPHQADLVRPGAPLERHLLHVLAVVLRDAARLNEGADQVVFDGPELGAPRVPLADTTTRSHFHTGTPEAEEPASVCTCMP